MAARRQRAARRDVERGYPPVGNSDDPTGDTVALAATRALLKADSREQAARVLRTALTDMGATVVPARLAAASAASVDVSLGVGEPLVVEVGPMPYPVMNTLLDEGFPRGALNYWKSSFVESLDDELIDVAVERFDSTPSPLNAILFEHFHGAVTRVGATDTAVPHRDEGYNMLLPSVWLDPAETEANVAWTRATFDLFTPYFAGRRWLNYFSDDDLIDAIRAAYGPNYDRLVEVKRRHDPENVFHLNHNIDPGGAS